MMFKNYNALLVCFFYLMLSCISSYALSPQSQFSQKATILIPHVLTSNMDGKNDWYFIGGVKNPFTYMRTEIKDRTNLILEIGSATNYISLFEFKGVINAVINKAAALEENNKLGASFNLNVLPLGNNIEVDLKYFNDGRALRDLKRMFSGVDPRALKDIIDLLNRAENPFMATPKYEIAEGKAYSYITIDPHSDHSREIKVELSLPVGYSFEILAEGVEKTIQMDEIKESIGLNIDLKKSYDELVYNLENKGSNWFQERNIRYDIESNELYFNQSRLSIHRDKQTQGKFNLKVAFYDNIKTRPKALPIEDIFTQDTLNLVSAINSDAELRELYIAALSLTKMLATDNTVLAGVPNYITYFGRDTLYTLLFLFNHLKPTMREHFLQQVISRAGINGECAHEVDTRYDKNDERHYDYRMADSDFIFSTTILRYLESQKNNTEELKFFLEHVDKRNRFGTKNGEVMVKNLLYTLTKLDENNVLGLKRKDDPSSGNWRDALNSLGRGEYPYDLNCVWPQKMLYFLNKIADTPEVLELLKPYIPKYSILTEVLNNFKVRRNLKRKWQKTKEKFKVELSLEQWRAKLKRYYEADEADPWRNNLLHNMPIGKDENNRTLCAYDFIYNNLIPKTLPNGDVFSEKFVSYSMCLDADLKPTEIIHSDLSLEPLFFDNEFYEEHTFDRNYYHQLFESYTQPLSLGGLGIYNRLNKYIGFVISNPILAANKGYNLVLTPKEQSDKVDPYSLSPWQLLNVNSYHGMGAVWSFQKDFYTIARAKVGMPITATDFKELYKQEEPIRPEIFTVNYEQDDFKLKYKSEIEGLSINPCQLWNTAIISVIDNQLKNLINPVVGFSSDLDNLQQTTIIHSLIRQSA